MRPLPTSSQGNKCMLVFTDIFTKWVEAFALKDTTASTLATVLLNTVISCYGAPCNLHSDQVKTSAAMLFNASAKYQAFPPPGLQHTILKAMDILSGLTRSKTMTDNQHDWDS